MQRKFWGLTMADVHLAYQLAVRNGIKKTIFREKLKDRKKVGENFSTSS